MGTLHRLKKIQTGLSHVALMVDSLETLKEMHPRLRAHNVQILRAQDHGFTKSLYFEDPEDSEIKIYCEAAEPPWQSLDTFIRTDPLELEA